MLKQPATHGCTWDGVLLAVSPIRHVDCSTPPPLLAPPPAASLHRSSSPPTRRASPPPPPGAPTTAHSTPFHPLPQPPPSGSMVRTGTSSPPGPPCLLLALSLPPMPQRPRRLTQCEQHRASHQKRARRQRAAGQVQRHQARGDHAADLLHHRRRRKDDRPVAALRYRRVHDLWAADPGNHVQKGGAGGEISCRGKQDPLWQRVQGRARAKPLTHRGCVHALRLKETCPRPSCRSPCAAGRSRPCGCPGTAGAARAPSPTGAAAAAALVGEVRGAAAAPHPRRQLRYPAGHPPRRRRCRSAAPRLPAPGAARRSWLPRIWSSPSPAARRAMPPFGL